MNLLNFIGMGVVTSTKDTNTSEIMVYIPALFPTADGRAVAVAQTVERMSVNAKGEEVKSALLHSNSVPAIWKKMDESARISPPDVREGSGVAIYQVSGQNQYYWTSFGVNNNTFRMETVMYGWNANPKLAEDADFDIDNYYVLKVDTRTGLIALRTSQANGEAAAFDVQINAMDGVISAGGSNKSFLVFDDKNHSFTYTNDDGSVLNIDKRVGNFYFKDQLNLFADEAINLKTKVLNMQAEELNADIQLTRWKGRFELTGDIEQVGDFTQDGNIETTGQVYAEVDVISKVSLNKHLTSGVQGGDGTSGPPVPAKP